MRRIAKGGVAAVGVVAAGAVAWLVLRPTVLESGPPAPVWTQCQPGQVQVMVLGTFHFGQQDEIDILSADRQGELDAMVSGLAEWRPDRVAVEQPYAENADLNGAYAAYVEAGGASTSRNEVVQVGFRLASALGHDSVYGVDVPMKLWHDSIQVFDDRFPEARGRLRRTWDVRYPSSPETRASATLVELLREWNENPPSNAEYGLFMPLAEGDVYAGALKLRPWYDRNLRIVQNFFRVVDPDDERLFLVIGGSHVRVLRHLLDMTPQLCAVDPLPWIGGDAAALAPNLQ